MNELGFADFLLWEANARNALLVRKQYVEMAGGFKAGAVLGRIVYYYLPGRDGKPHKLRVKKDNEYWIAKSREEWQTETFLTEKEFDKAMKQLIQHDLVEKKTFHFGGVPTLHVRLIVEQFLETLGDALSQQVNEADSYFAEMAKWKLPKGEKQDRIYNIYINKDIQTEVVTDLADDDASDPGLSCPECGSNRVVTEQYDKKRRCAYCLLRAAWAYYFPKKPQPKLGTATHRAKAEKRWKDLEFRRLYRTGLERASRSHTCNTKSWFDFAFFVANETNYMKMQPDGFWMEWKDEADGHFASGTNEAAASAGVGQM